MDSALLRRTELPTACRVSLIARGKHNAARNIAHVHIERRGTQLLLLESRMECAAGEIHPVNPRVLSVTRSAYSPESPFSVLRPRRRAVWLTDKDTELVTRKIADHFTLTRTGVHLPQLAISANR